MWVLKDAEARRAVDMIGLMFDVRIDDQQLSLMVDAALKGHFDTVEIKIKPNDPDFVLLIPLDYFAKRKVPLKFDRAWSEYSESCRPDPHSLVQLYATESAEGDVLNVVRCCARFIDGEWFDFRTSERINVNAAYPILFKPWLN